MKNRSGEFAILAVLVIASVIALFAWQLTGHVDYPDNAVERAIATLAALMVIALLLERSFAVLFDLISPPAERSDLRERLILGQSANVDADLRRLSAIHGEQVRWRIWSGLVAGLLLGLGGVRTLANLGDSVPAASGQLGIFSAMDVILTAGLLTGGSAAIAAIIDILRMRALLALMRYRQETVGAQTRRRKAT